MSGYVRVAPGAPPDELRLAIERAEGRHLAIAPADARDDELLVLERALNAPGVASASPLPVATTVRDCYPLHPLLPPAPTLALPCRSFTMFHHEALLGLGAEHLSAITAERWLIAAAQDLLQRGWRHVGAPGLAMNWDPSDASGIDSVAAWNPTVVAEFVGPANSGLETHRAWAASRITRLHLVVDGACVTSDPHTGTQHLVVQVARELANSRPHADVVLAVPAASMSGARAAVEGAAVTVRDRSKVRSCDVLYRPYQMLFASELEFVTTVGRRRVVGQLDMIGFSNPFYHPSPELFWIARNLQRHLMRTADGVTFISEFGRHSAVADCPDLEPSRLHVVSCGADPTPDEQAPGVEPARPGFVLCLSATFWHKNRAQAISTFAELAERGYQGGLLIAGPEPFYGRSTEADAERIRQLPTGVAERIQFLGQVSESEKWRLLDQADVVLYPSVVEGFGLVPFEAAAVGTPSLTFAGTAPGELLASTDATIETWDPAAWADRAQGWIADQDRSAEVVAQIHSVGASHTWRQCAELTWDAIDATLAQPVRAGAVEEGGRISNVASTGPLSERSRQLRFTLAALCPRSGDV